VTFYPIILPQRSCSQRVEELVFKAFRSTTRSEGRQAEAIPANFRIAQMRPSCCPLVRTSINSSSFARPVVRLNCRVRKAQHRPWEDLSCVCQAALISQEDDDSQVQSNYENCPRANLLLKSCKNCGWNRPRVARHEAPTYLWDHYPLNCFKILHFDISKMSSSASPSK